MPTPAEIQVVIKAQDLASKEIQKFISLLSSIPAAAGPITSALATVDAAMKGVGTSAGTASAPMKEFSDSMTQVNRRATAAAKSVAELKVHMGALGGVGSSSSVVALTGSMTGASASAERASGAFADIKNKLKDLSFGALLAGSTLTAAFTAPIAMIVQSGYEFNVMRNSLAVSTEAFYKSATAADELYVNLRQLSDLTPFEMEDFIKGAGMIQPFTKDVGELENAMDIVAAAAMASGKITSMSVDRISLAFSQMLAAGKLTGNELRQLTEANVDVLGALSAKLGKSKAEIRDMISEGEIGAKDAINAIGQFLGPRFSELLDKFSHSLPAAISSGRDALKELQATLQAPVESKIADVILAITPYIKVLTQEAAKLSPEVLNMFAAFAIGAAAMGPLLIAVSGFVILVNLLFNPLGAIAVAFGVVAAAAIAMAAAVALNVGGLRDVLGPSLEQMANQLLDFAVRMSEFGANIIVAFADGMISAFTVLAPVIASIGEFLAYWLAPGSPPKAAPNIDKYGAGTMEEWLKGFLAADFSILSGISKNVEDILGAIVPSGSTEFINTLLDIRMAVAHIINEIRTLGSASEDAWGQLRDAAGESYDKIKNIIDAYYELEGATKAVADQQKEITRLTREWDAALKPLQTQMDALNREQAKIDRAQAEARLADQVAHGKADPKELALLRQKNMLQDQMDAIKENRDASLDAAKEELDKRKDIEEAAKDHLAVLQGQVGAMADMVKLVGQLEKAQAGGGGGGKGPGGAGIDASRIALAAEKGAALAESMKKFNEALANAGPRLAAMAANMETAAGKIADMFAVLQGKDTRVEKIFKDVGPGMIPLGMEDMAGQSRDFGFNSKETAAQAQDAKAAWDKVVAFFRYLDKSFDTSLGGGPANIGSKFGEWAKKGQLSNGGSSMMDPAVAQQNRDDMANAAGALAGLVASSIGLTAGFEGAKAGVAAWDKMVAETGASIGAWWEGVQAAWSAGLASAGANLQSFFNEVVVPMWTNIMVTVGGFFSALGTMINQAGIDIWTGLNRAKDDTIAKLSEIWEHVSSVWNTIMAFIQTKWDEAMKELDTFAKALAVLYEYLKTQVTDAFKGVYDKLIIMTQPLQDFYDGMVNAAGAIARFIASLPGGGAIAALLGQGGGNPPAPAVDSSKTQGIASAGLRINAAAASGGGSTINVYPAIYNTLDAAVWAKRIAREKAARQ